MNKPKNETQSLFSIQEDQPSSWFEPLYSGATKDGEGVPWANMKTHPSFANWLSRHSLDGTGLSALVVGCGMGDDAIELETLGFQVTAFDVSETAIAYCKERFPHSKVDFRQADLLEKQTQWRQKYDFVLEIFTVQALPPKYETRVIQNISDFLAPGGQLLVVAEVDQEPRSFDNGPPWRLTPDHINVFKSCGLDLLKTEMEASSMDSDGDMLVSTFIRPHK